MIVVLQRVSRVSVAVEGEVIGKIGAGLLALVAVERDDSEREAQWCAAKTASIRLFPDDDGKMNLSTVDVGGEVLAVSQFTLVGNLRKGTRPSFSKAAAPEIARPLFDLYAEVLRRKVNRVETGRFGANMKVELVNDGPVTVILRRQGEGRG